MAASDVCLGVFGTSPKSQRVIPNKVFDALAVGRPVVTADTPAVREVLTHGEKAWLCPPGDPDALAERPARACGPMPAARRRLARPGPRALRRTVFDRRALAHDLATIVLEALDR